MDLVREVRRQGFLPLPIAMEHAQLAGALASDHREPVARMLVAQAIQERMALVPIEFALDGLGAIRVW